MNPNLQPWMKKDDCQYDLEQDELQGLRDLQTISGAEAFFDMILRIVFRILGR